jgi:hypothetical protein
MIMPCQIVVIYMIGLNALPFNIPIVIRGLEVWKLESGGEMGVGWWVVEGRE